MVMFEVIGKNGKYLYTTLNGNNFYLKAQEVLEGRGRYKEHLTASEAIRDLEIKIISIDIEKEEINKNLREYYIYNEDVVGFFSPIYSSTLDKYYQKCYQEQNIDFYQNLCDNYSKEKLKKIIYLFLYKNLSVKWLMAYFDMEEYDLLFILENLPSYYSFMEEVGNGIFD